MSDGVVVITDSTAGLTAEEAATAGVDVVPLQVIIDDESRPEGPTATAADVAVAMRAKTPVSTSRPSPETFSQAYRKAAEGGAETIVSAHLSAQMSATYEAAWLGARRSPVPVTVVDSGTLGLGLGYPVLAGAQLAGRGAGVAEVAALIKEQAAQAQLVFYVDTLEYLRRGGRVGHAQALLGNALAVKPLLTLRDGRIAPLEKVRTKAKAIARLAELAVLAVERVAGTGEPVRVAVNHLASADRAGELAADLVARFARVGIKPEIEAADLVVREVGAVLGAHVGPGLLAVVVVPG